jgi:small subunit ribosomal protein S7e
MEAPKKLSQIFARKKSGKDATFTHIEQSTGNALIDIISHFEGENKRIGSFIEINRVVEVPNGKDKPSILVYFSYKSRKVLLLPIQKKLISELEKKLKTTVLLVCARNIQSRWIKKNRTQKRPFSRTLTSVYEEILTELLLPGIIISDRTRVRLDGSSVRKLVLDKTDEHFFEDRSQAIINAYKKLTNREI